MARARALAGTLLLCAVGLPTAALAKDFYVDPLQGSAQGDGSASAPWKSIQAVVDAGLIQSRNWDKLPYDSTSTLVVRNAGAPVQAGDTIYLRDGAHGALTITGYYNSAMITIAAQAGHKPRLDRLLLRSVANWTVRGLTVGPASAASCSGDLVAVASHAHSGPAESVLLQGCTVRSAPSSAGWSSSDWNDKTCNGFGIGGTKITVRQNVVRNIDFGISVSASHSLVEHNLVDGFAGDGLRGLGDHTTFQYNTVKNCYDVNANHDDGFQSWSRGSDGKVGTGQVTGVVLRGNRIINYEDPSQPFRCTLQGIGMFDGTFVDWVIENNVIVTDHWHGITLMGAKNCRVVNNTVIDPNSTSPGPPWIRIVAHKDGTPPSGCVVRNNLTTDLSNATSGVAEDHNLIVTAPADHFVDPAAYDLHLLATSAAIDVGSASLAPAEDADGAPRPFGTGIDVGAYEWGSTKPAPDAGVADAGLADAQWPGDLAAADGMARDAGGADAPPADATSADGAAADNSLPADARAVLDGPSGGPPTLAGDSGCSCAVGQGSVVGGGFVWALLLLAWLRRRR